MCSCLKFCIIFYWLYISIQYHQLYTLMHFLLAYHSRYVVEGKDNRGAPLKVEKTFPLPLDSFCYGFLEDFANCKEGYFAIIYNKWIKVINFGFLGPLRSDLTFTIFFFSNTKCSKHITLGFEKISQYFQCTKFWVRFVPSVFL